MHAGQIGRGGFRAVSGVCTLQLARAVSVVVQSTRPNLGWDWPHAATSRDAGGGCLPQGGHRPITPIAQNGEAARKLDTSRNPHFYSSKDGGPAEGLVFAIES